MNITGGIILYAVTWFMVFFCVLPVRFVSQADAGEVVPGTHRSAPANVNDLGRKAKFTTGIAAVVWMIAAFIILGGFITMDDLDVFGRMAR
jgi:predicted secreted protein